MRAYLLHILLPILLLGLSSAWAAAPAAPAALATPAPATAPAAPAAATGKAPIDQRIEHIEVIDSGARVNELRVGGETQSISVQPSNGMPAYEVIPANGARNRRLDERDGGSGSVGQRVWNLISF